VAATQPTTPSIVVYDLPPGANPVLHRAASGGAEAGASPAAEAPSEQAASDTHIFYYDSSDGETDVIGMWSPAGRDHSPDAAVKALICRTNNRETSERWRAELAAGRLPQSSANAPE
jgi:hypothetical protein